MTFLQKCLSVVIILFTINAPAFSQTQATASVNTNKVIQGDVFILSIEVNNTGSEYQLDTTPLKKDFTVFLPSRSEKRSYINGDYAAQTTWQVRLQANKIGSFTLPSLTIGDVNTQPIKIDVLKPTVQQQSTQGKSIFIENSINESNIYLGQQVTLDSKIYVSENINNADIQEPILADAIIEKIDSQPQTQIIRNGIRYQVFTYQYKITPSIAGEQIIKSPLLIGEMAKQVNQWQGQRFMQPITIRGNNVTLTVKAIPDHYQGEWLVSTDVRLIENNDLHAQEHHVGDPITRSISLQVASLPIEKMPEIKLNYDSTLRYYPDQDDLKQGEIQGKSYTQRTITHAIIATKSGEITLPEIKIPWWNSVTDQQEFATLPAQTLTIKPAIQGSHTQPNNLSPTDVEALKQSLHNTTLNSDSTTQLWMWKISSIVLFTLLLLLSVYHWQYRKKVNNKKAITTTTEQNTPYKLLLMALQQANPQQVYACLLRYLQSQQPHLTQIHAIVSITGLSKEKMQQLSDNLQQLEQACAGQTHRWNAKELSTLIKMHHKVTKQENINSISDLNP